MDSRFQDQLYEQFLAASGAQQRGLEETLGVADDLAGTLETETSLLGSTQAQGQLPGMPGTSAAATATPTAGVTDPLTEALNRIGSRETIAASRAESSGTDPFAATPAGTSTRGGSTFTSAGQGTSGSGSTAESVVTTFLESGFGVVPLITSLFGLFGGGTSAPPPLEKYQMPSPISFASADTGDTLTAADYDQMGRPRVYSRDAAGTTAGDGAGPASNYGAPASSSASSGGASQPQITVNVQAMDAQSFLDRSDDIAKAVRAAMLNMSTINDVVNEL